MNWRITSLIWLAGALVCSASAVSYRPFFCEGYLLKQPEEPVHVTAPKGFKVVIVTDRYLLGSDHPIDLIDPLNQRLWIIDRDTFEDVGNIDTQMYEKVIAGKVWKGFRLRPKTNRGKRGEGVSTEAKFATLSYGFTRFDVEGSIALVDDYNEASLKLHRKLGYQKIAHDAKERYSTLWLSREKFAAVKKEVEAMGLKEFSKPRTPLRIAETHRLILQVKNPSRPDERRDFDVEVLDKESLELVGSLRVEFRDEQLGREDVSALRISPRILPDKAKQGFATEAEFAALDYAFAHFEEIDGSMARVEKDLKASVKLHTKLGYEILTDQPLTSRSAHKFWLSREQFLAKKKEISKHGPSFFAPSGETQ